MHVDWTQERTEDNAVLDDYVGIIVGEPAFRLEANRWGWRVLIDGAVARGEILTDVGVARVERRRLARVDRVALAKERAEAWAKSVIQQRGDR